MNPENLNTFPERLKWARTQRGMTQEALAFKTGMSQTTIGNYEAGVRGKRLDANKIKLLADALWVNFEWLLTGEGSAYLAKQELTQYKINKELSSWPFKTPKSKVEQLTPAFIKLIDKYIADVVEVWEKDDRYGPKDKKSLTNKKENEE